MKKVIFFAVMSALLIACSKNNNQPSDRMVDVTVSLSGLDIEVTPENAPSHKPMASDKNATQAKVKRIGLNIYDATSGTLVKSISETSTDANFGQDTTFRLPVGSYKFIAVAHAVAQNSDPVATINSATEISFGAMIVGNPTYTATQDVTISGNTTQAVTVDFGTRKNATFGVKITDTTPSDVAGIEIIVSPASTAYTDLKVSPSTGFAAAQWQYKKSFTLAGLGISTLTNSSFSCPLFLTAASQQLDVTVNVFNSDGTTLYTRTLENVTFQQAHRTLATGTFFSSEATASFVFDITETDDNISLD